MAVSTTLTELKTNRIKRLDLKVGYSCINDCLFCVVADKRLRGDKTTDEIKQELIASYEEGRREVVFTGGEAAIRKDIFELVSFARNLGFLNIQMQTNGRMFSSLDFAVKMARCGMTEFGPSLHGQNARIHDALTRRTGSWRETVLGIHNVKKIGIRTLTNTVITQKNYRNLPEIASLLVKLKVDQFQLAFVHIMGNALKYYRKVVPRVSTVIPFIKDALDVGIKAGVRVMVEAVPFCLLSGYERYASEFYLPSTQVKEVGYQIDDFGKVRKEEGKCKFQSCLECRRYRVCEGPWKEYPRLFGEKEFKPVL